MDIKNIYLAVKRRTGMGKDELLQKTKDRDRLFARRLFIALMKAEGCTYSSIARELGQDHTTVIHAFKQSQISAQITKIVQDVRSEKEYWNAASLSPQVQFLSKGIYANIYTVYGSKCVVCSFDEVVEVHHIVPRREGGSDDPDNVVVLCPNHHALADRGMLQIRGIHIEKSLSTPL
jgi:predicted restriction endonuclease